MEPVENEAGCPQRAPPSIHCHFLTATLCVYEGHGYHMEKGVLRVVRGCVPWLVFESRSLFGERSMSMSMSMSERL